MSPSSAPVWASVDRATHRENSSANHGTAHGFGRLCAAVQRTVIVANTDTITVTATDTIELSES
jgi:hypothetical protein